MNDNTDNEDPNDDLLRNLQKLAQYQPEAPPYLAARIVANLPDISPLERLVGWFTATMWRGATAAVIPLMIGFVIGVSGTHPADDDVTAWYDAEDLVYATTIEEYNYDEI